MFLCKKCCKKLGYEWPLSGSYGPCEKCHKTDTCGDVPHWVSPKKNA